MVNQNTKKIFCPSCTKHKTRLFDANPDAIVVIDQLDAEGSDMTIKCSSCKVLLHIKVN